VINKFDLSPAYHIQQSAVERLFLSKFIPPIAYSGAMIVLEKSDHGHSPPAVMKIRHISKTVFACTRQS